MKTLPPIVRNIGAGVLLALLLFFAYKFTLGKEDAAGPLVEQGPVSTVRQSVGSMSSAQMSDAAAIAEAHSRLNDLSEIDTSILDDEVIRSLKDARIPLSVGELSEENTGRDNPFAPATPSRSSSAR
ncbi:MAG: hypothetical protein A2408_00580 [Candidatus Yonathbacteria bacterium RIFOXYC1_FULL_52_10]|uniref:Uncharacterized protein n=1 Tax=Candidatus Yonathbacteria bacterium RIFOXYD1_FULL_52_36 TaxID=1802730 RepID=A0A1G2SII0_9BACT|nr:MAG: hypothetical protein A2408_00580 [Candidatus Yonathbacteria bacterium RIFOXYC1_FULL_52_10]OHA84845.1 MAG: hypothetical protein A2591_00745 [Candidatus Yonathbacteria bacterium RIFOXYD1_FULL_52_36]